MGEGVGEGSMGVDSLVRMSEHMLVGMVQALVVVGVGWRSLVLHHSSRGYKLGRRWPRTVRGRLGQVLAPVGEGVRLDRAGSEVLVPKALCMGLGRYRHNQLAALQCESIKSVQNENLRTVTPIGVVDLFSIL